jgi:hypothetical protein
MEGSRFLAMQTLLRVEKGMHILTKFERILEPVYYLHNSEKLRNSGDSRQVLTQFSLHSLLQSAINHTNKGSSARRGVKKIPFFKSIKYIFTPPVSMLHRNKLLTYQLLQNIR